MAGGIKKKSSLRNKSERKSQLANKISQFKQEAQSQSQSAANGAYHENPLLKIAKTTKKQKQQEKSDKFIDTLVNKVTFNTSGNLSKSSLRRKKRKEKEHLKPKMDDLLHNLPTEDTEAASASRGGVTRLVTHKAQKAQDNKYLESNKSNLNKPNPTKRRGYKQIMKEENKNFSSVLKNPQFRALPFDALKNAIKQNMEK
ncbi:uncharacterized protein LODBEIA_P25090 [Lodderomyces beijingensis]|uniref:Ribosome biogenesis protein SLX9 n=1 Tax=Lodderomyces beijingensis TaxID=1775926 RepID=A0ABP0ZM64_9ASCO